MANKDDDNKPVTSYVVDFTTHEVHKVNDIPTTYTVHTNVAYQYMPSSDDCFDHWGYNERGLDCQDHVQFKGLSKANAVLLSKILFSMNQKVVVTYSDTEEFIPVADPDFAFSYSATCTNHKE